MLRECSGRGRGWPNPARSSAALLQTARREAVRCAKEDAALRTACRKFASFLSSLGRSPGEVDREQFGQLLRTLRHQVGSKLIRRLTFTTSMCIGLGPVVER